MESSNQYFVDLIRKAKRDRDALGKLLNDIQHEIYKVAYYLSGKDKDIAEDIAQDILLKIAQNIKNLRNEEAFFSWVYKIGRNVYFKKYAPKIRKEIILSSEEIHQIKEKISSDLLKEMELKEEILMHIDKLPELLRLVLLESIEGKSYKEIAESCSIKVGTIKSSLSRAKDMLKKFLKK